MQIIRCFLHSKSVKLIRTFTLSAVTPNHNKSSQREAKFLNKLISGSNNKNKKTLFFDPPVTASSFKQLGKVVKRPQCNLKRMSVLNKLLMRNITDVMSSGKFMEKLDPYGIVVTNVRIAQDFNIANILWISTNPSALPENIDKLLHSASLVIHNELNWLQIMGNLPELQFIPDKKEMRVAYFNETIKNADFGPDDIEDVLSCEKSDTTETWPDMTHDIYGLQHSLIMGKIKPRQKTKTQMLCEEKFSNVD